MLNRLLIGVSIIAAVSMLTMWVGAEMNDLVSEANGGQMPVLLRPEYHNAEQLIKSSPKHCIATEETKYFWLCDRYYSAVGMHVKSVYSIGDIFIWAGDWIFKIAMPIFVLLMLLHMRRWEKQKKQSWKSIVEE